MLTGAPDSDLAKQQILYSDIADYSYLESLSVFLSPSLQARLTMGSLADWCLATGRPKVFLLLEIAS